MTAEQRSRAEVCQAILRHLGLGLLFRDDGPTAEAFDLAPDALTPYQRVAVRAALAVWSGELTSRAIEALGLLPPRPRISA